MSLCDLLLLFKVMCREGDGSTILLVNFVPPPTIAAYSCAHASLRVLVGLHMQLVPYCKVCRMFPTTLVAARSVKQEEEEMWPMHQCRATIP